MKQALSLAILLALASLLGFGLWQKDRADRAEARADAAESLVEAHEEANRILNSHLRKVEEDRERWKREASNLEGKEGIVEALSPYLRAVLDLVR